MTYRVDAGMKAMEAAVADPLVYGSLTPTAIPQLPSRHSSMLSPSKLGKCPVVIASP